jgi:hypothetical protein
VKAFARAVAHLGLGHPLRASCNAGFRRHARGVPTRGLADVAPTDLLYQHTVGLIDRLEFEPEAARADLVSFLQMFEREHGQSEAVDDLIDDGVLTMLMSGKGEPDLTGLLGPTIRVVLNKERSWRARPSEAALVCKLVTAVPTLEPLADQHTYGDHRDDARPPLPRRRRLPRGGQPAGGTVRGGLYRPCRAGGGVQRGGRRADRSRFVENLPYPKELGADIVDLLGPRLRAELQRQRPSLQT